jgi:integrase
MVAAEPRKPRKVNFTDPWLKSLSFDALNAAEQKAGRQERNRFVIWDGTQPAFGLRLTKSAKTFFVAKRRPGFTQPDIVTVGRYDQIALKKAREKAREILGILADGKTPAEIAAEQRQADAREAARRRDNSFGAVVEKFIAFEKTKGLRTVQETVAVLRREFLGQHPVRVRREPERPGDRAEWVTEWAEGESSIWRDRPIFEIKRGDVLTRLRAVQQRGGKHAARHALSAVRKLFNWALDEEDEEIGGNSFGLEESPVASIRDKKLGITNKDLQRGRVLDDDELRDVWLAADQMGYPFGKMVQWLMLNGQRLNDVACARRPEIDLTKAVLTVPPERYKTGIAQLVPITPKGVEICEALPNFGKGYLFSTTSGSRPISGFSKAKARLDKIIAERRAAEGREPMPHWVLHDLRRTVRTRLSKLGVEAYIAERIIGHRQPGLHAVYDRDTHLDQKRAGLEKWEAALMAIVEPKPKKPTKRAPVKKLPKNVVSFEPARRRA